MQRSTLVAVAAVLLVLIVIFVFRAEIWFTITWIVDKFVLLLLFLVDVLKTIALALWGLLLAALAVALPILVYVLAWIISISVFLFGTGLVLQACMSLARQIAAKSNEVAVLVRQLDVNFTEETKRTGRDAAFLALVAILAALVAYMATDDFLDKFSTIRFLAACAIGLVASKIFMLFDSRVAKFSGIFMTITIVVSFFLFMNWRYQIISDPSKAAEVIGHKVSDLQHVPKTTLLVIMFVLSSLALLYPFTLMAWRKLLTMPPKGPAEARRVTRSAV